MTTQRVNLGDISYDIRMDAVEAFGDAIKEVCAPRGQLAVVTDRTVWELHGKAFQASLRTAGFNLAEDAVLVLPPGERNKSMEVLGDVFRFFAQVRLTRDGLVVAFGGGVIGDLAGFAAAAWMRGVPYVQVPTSLLAQVDSSVGGKTAIDLPQGKNLVGAFHQPRLVLIDTRLLDTLAPRDFRCGMAEVVKYGAIFSRELFDKLSTPPDGEELSKIVAQCCRFKADVVEKDEKEAGLRRLLNFGHTLGHAIEKLGGYQTHTHGEAISMGMVLAAEIGESLGFTRGGVADQLRRVLSVHGLPCDSPYEISLLHETAKLDKKAGADGIAFVLLRDIGDAFLHLI